MAGPSFLRLYPNMQVLWVRTNSRRSALCKAHLSGPVIEPKLRTVPAATAGFPGPLPACFLHDEARGTADHVPGAINGAEHDDWRRVDRSSAQQYVAEKAFLTVPSMDAAAGLSLPPG